MASNINIQKKCEWCGKLFIAHKISTRCCSRRCANLAYKEKTRQKRVSEFQTMVNQQIEKEDCIDKDFFTPSEAAKYIGISRATFYRYLETNLIKSVQLKRKTIIRKRTVFRLTGLVTKISNARTGLLYSSLLGELPIPVEVTIQIDDGGERDAEQVSGDHGDGGGTSADFDSGYESLYGLLDHCGE